MDEGTFDASCKAMPIVKVISTNVYTDVLCQEVKSEVTAVISHLRKHFYL
jgi:hypothetical protein